MTTDTWRAKFRPMIAKLIEENSGEKNIRKLQTLVNRECPFQYQASSWMMKVWRDEVAEQIGLKRIRKSEKRRIADLDRGQKFFEIGEEH